MFQQLKYYFTNPSVIPIVLLEHFGQWLPDSLYVRIMYRLRIGHRLHLRNPKTFNEKIQWLKLYNRRPEYTMMVDKYAVKEYVSGLIGEEYIIPTLGVWEKPEDIDFDVLPNKFVLKTTHGGGSTGVIICKDKYSFDRADAIEKLKRSMKQDIYKYQKEWPYKNVHRRIIAEQYIDPVPGKKDLPDYKLFCFNGEVKALFVATDRQKEGEDVKFDFFDAEFNHLPFKQGHENAQVMPHKPRNFEMMKCAAAKLSKDIPLARVDFYEVADRVLFGEITFFHFSGTVPFEPDKWDRVLGDMLTLPGEKRGGVIINELQDDTLQFSRPDLNDYKFYCFGGKPEFMLLISEREIGGDAKCDYYDMNFNHLPFSWAYPHSKNPITTPPSGFEKMKELAAKISKTLPHARIDLYNVNGKIYFGEITLYHGGGFCKFEPFEWDYKYGEMIELPPKTNS